MAGGELAEGRAGEHSSSAWVMVRLLRHPAKYGWPGDRFHHLDLLPSC